MTIDPQISLGREVRLRHPRSDAPAQNASATARRPASRLTGFAAPLDAVDPGKALQ